MYSTCNSLVTGHMDHRPQWQPLFCFVLFLQCTFSFFALIFVLFVADDLPIWGKSHEVKRLFHDSVTIVIAIGVQSLTCTIYIKFLKFTCGFSF